jgi:transcriptional regulator with XRE-family HTH domain
MTPAQLRSIRRDMDLTQAEFGKRIGISRVTVCQMELGKAPITERTVAAVHNIAPSSQTFEQAWGEFEAKGYCYGKDALENVRFGWEIAKGLRP